MTSYHNGQAITKGHGQHRESADHATNDLNHNSTMPSPY